MCFYNDIPDISVNIVQKANLVSRNVTEIHKFYNVSKLNLYI